MKLTEFESNLKNKITTLHNKINLINDRLLGSEPKRDKCNEPKALYSHRDIMIDSIDELRECLEDLRPSFLAFCFEEATDGESSEPKKELPPVEQLSYVARNVLLSIRCHLDELHAKLGVESKDEKDQPVIEKAEPICTYNNACIDILCVLEECLVTCCDILGYIGNDERPTVAGGVSN